MSQRKISKAIDRVNKQITSQTDQTNMYSRGLSREGYLGGYIQALEDVSAMLRKVPISSQTRKYWEEQEDK